MNHDLTYIMIENINGDKNRLYLHYMDISLCEFYLYERNLT